MRLALIAALAVLVLVRVEHLVATDIWIWLRGARWRKRIRELDKSALRDPARLWQEYHALGAGRLPFLIFGVKSYRLLAWSRQRGHGSALIRLRAITASLVRPVWRWYFFAPGVALVVTVLAYLVDDSTVYERAGLLTIGFLLMLGSLAIAAEGTLAVSQMKSWAAMHHSWPSLKHRKNVSHERELSVYAGSFIVTCFCALALYSVAARLSVAFDGDSATHAVLPSVLRGASSVVSGLFAVALNESKGAVGHAVNGIFGVVFFAYTYFLGNAVQRTLK